MGGRPPPGRGLSSAADSRRLITASTSLRRLSRASTLAAMLLSSWARTSLSLLASIVAKSEDIPRRAMDLRSPCNPGSLWVMLVITLASQVPRWRRRLKMAETKRTTPRRPTCRRRDRSRLEPLRPGAVRFGHGRRARTRSHDRRPTSPETTRSDRQDRARAHEGVRTTTSASSGRRQKPNATGRSKSGEPRTDYTFRSSFLVRSRGIPRAA